MLSSPRFSHPLPSPLPLALSLLHLLFIFIVIVIFPPAILTTTVPSALLPHASHLALQMLPPLVIIAGAMGLAGGLLHVQGEGAGTGRKRKTLRDDFDFLLDQRDRKIEAARKS